MSKNIKLNLHSTVQLTLIAIECTIYY